MQRRHPTRGRCSGTGGNPPPVDSVSPNPNNRRFIFACTACSFTTKSFNNLCRHFLMTLHTLAQCPECSTYVIHDEFYSTVKHWLGLMRRWNVQLNLEHVDSVQGHPHDLTVTLPCIAAFKVECQRMNPRTLQQQPRERVMLHCLECLNVFLNWTSLTRHFEQAKHLSARCVECGETLKGFGPTLPDRHEDLTGHCGFWGTYYTRKDYEVNRPLLLNREQYRCFCGKTFINNLHIARHLRNDHHVQSIPDRATCVDCNLTDTLSDMILHRMDVLASDREHQFKIEGFSAARYIVRCPERARPIQNTEHNPRRVIWYQCPSCRSIFRTWDGVIQHRELTGHCPPTCTNCLCSMSSILSDAPVRRFDTAGGGSSTNQVRDHSILVHSQKPQYEVFLNPIDPLFRDLIDHPPAETLFVGFQCPEESCAAAFLTHGELFEHMELEGHLPKDATKEDSLKPWRSNAGSYEVVFTLEKLTQWFGFSQCQRCREVIRPGEEEEHRALCLMP